MHNHTITIPGKPIAQARPRFARRGRFVKTYSPQETEAGRTYLDIKSQWRLKPIDCPVVVSMVFTCPIPLSKSKKWKEGAKSGEIKHVVKSDIDNYGKFYLDCMNGLVWKDDCQVYELNLEKKYGEEPLTRITVEWI